MAASLSRLLGVVAFRKLLIGHGLGTLGQLQLTMAVGVDALARTGSGVWVSVAVALGFAPYLFFSVPAGVLADRYPRATVLRTSIGLRLVTASATTVGLFLGWSVPLVILFAAVTTVFATPSYPAVAAATPQLMHPEDLGQANTLVTGVENAAWVAGPGLLGLVLLLGAPVAAGGLAATGCLALGLLAVGRARTPRPMREEGVDANADDGILAGFRAVMSFPTIRRAMGLAGLDNFLYGYLVVAIVLVAEQQLGAGQRGTGWLNAALTVGAIASMAVTWRIDYERQASGVVIIGLLLQSGIVAALGFSSGVPIAFVLVLIAGVCQLVVEIMAVTIIQANAPEHLTGRIFGVYDAIAVGLIALGSGLAGVLAHAFGLTASLLVVGLMSAVVTVVTAARMVRVAQPGAAEE